MGTHMLDETVNRRGLGEATHKEDLKRTLKHRKYLISPATKATLIKTKTHFHFSTRRILKLLIAFRACWEVTLLH